MTGLEKIVTQIKSDTDVVCEDIKRKSDLRCEEIINNAKIKAEEINRSGEETAKSIKQDIINRAHSSASLEMRSIMLKSKQQIIRDSIANCYEYLCSLAPKDYFELILKMIAKYSENKSGEVFFSYGDLKRLPPDFDKSINFVSKGELHISDISADIDSGFILKYDKIEINCSFSSVFSSQSEAFSDAVSAILFG